MQEPSEITIQSADSQYLVNITNSNINNLHVGNQINTYFSVYKSDEEVLELETRIAAQLTRYHTEDNRILQLLPEFDDEELTIDEHYSPLKINEESPKENPNDLNLSDIISGEENIFILGDAGSGKSTLVKKMCFDWGKRLCLLNFKFVFNIPLRLVTDDITAYLYEFILLRNVSNEKCLQSFFTKNGKDVLIFLDGLDEYRNSNIESVKLFMQTFPNVTFVVTSRYSWDQCKLLKEKFKRQLVVKGFTNEGIHDFIHKYFKYSVRDYNFYIKQLINADDECGRKCVKNPILLWLSCYLFKTSSNRKPLKVTQLYEEMFKALTKIYNKRRNENIDEHRMYTSLIKYFGNLAFKAIVEDDIVFNQNAIDDSFITKLGFLREESFMENNRKVKKYQPIHKTFLEFVAAVYMKDVLQKNSNDFKSKILTLPNKSLHSKKSKSGSKISMFIVFLVGLLGDSAFKFYEIMEVLGDRYKKIADSCLLLWHSGSSAENLEFFAKSEIRLTPRCLTDMVDRSYNGESDFMWELLADILKHPKCCLKELTFNVSDLGKFSNFSHVIVKALENNTSISKIGLEKGNQALSINLNGESLLSYFTCFLHMVNALHVTELVINEDIFIDKLEVHFEFFKQFMMTLGNGNLSNLEVLIILTSPVVSELCETFFYGTIRKDNAVSKSKKQSKRKIPRLTDEHFRLFVARVNTRSLKHLQMSRLSVDCESLQGVNADLFPELNVLELPGLEILNKGDTGVNPIFDLLSSPNSKLEHLDVSGYKFNNMEVRHLVAALNGNNSLQHLNLAHCLTSTSDVIHLCQFLIQNKSLERLHLCSREISVNDCTLKLLFTFFSQSNLNELHLSGWKFEIEDAETLPKVSDLIGNSNLEILCVKSVNVCFDDCENCRDEITSFLTSAASKKLKAVDVRGFNYSRTPPKLEHSDSGYFSPGINNNSLNFCDKSFGIKNTLDSDFKEKLKLQCKSNVTFIFNDREYVAYKFDASLGQCTSATYQ